MNECKKETDMGQIEDLRLDNLEKQVEKMDETLTRIDKIITRWDVRLSDPQYLQCPLQSQKMNALEKEIETMKPVMENYKTDRIKILTLFGLAVVIGQLLIQLFIAPMISKKINGSAIVIDAVDTINKPVAVQTTTNVDLRFPDQIMAAGRLQIPK